MAHSHFTVRQRARRYGLNVSAGYHRAIRIIEHFGCCRAEEHPPESTACVGIIDDIESAPGDLGNICGRISSNDNPRVCGLGGFMILLRSSSVLVSRSS